MRCVTCEVQQFRVSAKALVLEHPSHGAPNLQMAASVIGYLQVIQ